MTIAVASGKGGTGKTTVAVGLAIAAERPIDLVDADVEEPNAHLLLHPTIETSEPVTVLVPAIDEALCTGCGECSRVCEFHAIAVVKGTPLLFPELCHGCGGCTLACPAGAIREVPREIGTIRRGRTDGVGFIDGAINVGEALVPPLVRALRREVSRDRMTIIDAPPGVSCPAVVSMRGADYIMLVAEPTPFGLHDLRLAVQTARLLAIPVGVVVNRAAAERNNIREYCRREDIPVLMDILENRSIAEAYCRGETAIDAVPSLRSAFRCVIDRVAEQCDA